MSRLALPPEIPAKLAKNTLYDVLCVGDSFGVDWTVFEAGISDQAKEAQARALEDGMQFSPSSKDVLRKTELAERKRKLAAARTLNAEAAEAPPRSQDADVRAMHAALNMTEENFDTPSKPKPGRDSDARRLFAAQRLRLLMGAVPRHIAKGEWRTIGLLAGPEEFYFNRMAEAAPHLLWLLVLSSDPAYTPERLAKGIMGVEARCIMRNSRAFITRHESSAVWGERPDTGVLTDAYAIRIVLEAACRTCRDRHGRQGICAFDLVPEFEVPGVTIGDRVQVIRRCSMPDSHGRPMIHGAVKRPPPPPPPPPAPPMLAAAESSDSDSDSEAEREAEAAAAARALDFTEEELERARSLPRAGQAMAAAFQAAIGEATASASGARAGGSMITAEASRAPCAWPGPGPGEGQGKGKAPTSTCGSRRRRRVPRRRGAISARRWRRRPQGGRCALPALISEPRAFQRRKGMTLPQRRSWRRARDGDGGRAGAAADAKASRELEVAEEYAMELEREREREGEPDAELAATVEAGRGTPSSPSPRRRVLPLPPSPPSTAPAAAHRGPAASDVSWRPSGNPRPSVLRPSQPSQRPPPSVQVPPRPPIPRRRGHARRHAASSLGHMPPPPPPAPARPPLPPAQQRRERERQLLRDQRAEAEADHDDGQASESDGEPPRATRLELARAELAVQPREAPEIDMSKYDDVTTYSKDNKSKKEAAIQDALRLFVKNNRIVRQRPYGPNSPPTFYVELPNLFVYDKLLAMTFHKTYESNPGSFEFTFSKRCSRATRTFVEESLQLEDVCPEMPVIPGFAFACDTHFVATETCDWPTVYGMLHPFMPNVVKHLADNGYVTADEFGYAAAVLYAFNLVGPWNFCDKPYCGIIKGQSGTGKSMGSAFSEHGGEEAICMVMAEGLDPKACSEEELKMRSGDAYSRNFKNVRGDDVRTKATRKVLVIVCNSFPQLENRMLEFFARVVLIPLDHKPAKKRTYLHSDIRENELPALMVAAFTFAWKIIHALSDGKASCIQAFEPAWLRAQRLGFWQETASCPSPASSSPTAPSTPPPTSPPEHGGLHDERRGHRRVHRAHGGPDTSAAVGADIENGRLDETLAGFGSWCRPYSYKLGGPALEAIAIPVAQFKDPAPDVGPFLVKPHTKGKGKRTRNSAPAFLPPSPRHGPQQRPGQQRIDEMLPRQVRPAYPRLPSRTPLPRPLLIQGQGLWAQRLQATIAFRAELDSGFRAGQIAGAEASERWRAFEAESAGLAKGLGYSYRRVPVLKDYASAAAREASRAKIDAAEEQAAREEAEDNARFRHLHH
eukprot:tig00000622_g2622.t1